MRGPFSFGDWHDDRVCIYDDSTDAAWAWISEAQGRPLPGELLTLIKAAPDLLEACEELLIYLGDWDDTGNETCVAARRAIANAKGQDVPNG